MSSGTTTDSNSLTLTFFSLLIINYKSFPVFILPEKNAPKYTLPSFCFSLFIYWSVLVCEAHYEYWIEDEFRAKLLETSVQNAPPCHCLFK